MQTVSPDRPGPDQRKTLLIVEDEPLVLMMLVDFLEETGYRVFEARDAKGALQFIDGVEPIDLMLTDIGLPGGTNGRQLADMARKLRPHLPIVFATGYSGNDEVMLGTMSAGMDIVAKPVSLDSLGAKIVKMIARANDALG